MIFYFTGTGNSKWVAEELGKILNDKVVTVTEKIDLDKIKDEARIGFVFPIYAWGVAEPMMNFIKQFPISTAYKFAVATCGQDCGSAMKMLKKDYKMQSCFSVIMPSNYVLGADIENDEIINFKIETAKVKIQEYANIIKNKETGYIVRQGGMGFVKTNIINKLFNKFARNTKSFWVDDNCISCGLCARSCPASAIQMKEGKPCWGGDCYMCTSCINNCPKQSIQYGKKTKNRKRYNIEKYK